MRAFLKKRGLAVVLFAGAAVLLIAGTGVSLAHHLSEGDVRAAPAALERETRRDALSLQAGVHVEALGVGTSQGVTLAPPVHRSAPVPTVDVRREVAPPVRSLPVVLGAELSLQSGEALRGGAAGDADATLQSVRQTPVPSLLPAALAAAALTGAGLLAWSWAGVKTWGQKLLAAPLIALYARVTRAEVFDNDVRERIFQAIRERPGIAATDLAKHAGVSWGTTMYHLEVLERNRMVTSLREGRHRRYFENGAGLAASKEVVALLHNRVTADVVEIVRRTPGATQKELAGAAGMTPQALHWHLSRLVGAGLVRKEREGRVVRHFSN